MVQTALAPHAETTTIANSHWVAQTADYILTVMEKGRSTWQMWHVRAEAQRQVRTADVPVNREQVCWWICSSRRCWSAGLLPLPDRVTRSRNRIIQRSRS
jgi:hypothetical protein